MMPKMMKCFTVLSLFLLITGTNMLVFRDSIQLDSRQVDTYKAGLDFFGKLAEVSQQSFKSDDQMKALQSLLGAFKHLPLASLGVSFANAMFSKDLDSDRKTMEKGFNNLNRGIERLDTKLKKIKNQIDGLKSHLAFGPLTTLEATSTAIDSSDKHPTDLDLNHRIIYSFTSNEQLKALLAIYKLVDGNVLFDSILKPHVENADVHKLLEISLYLTSLLARGFTDYVFIAKTYYMKYGKMNETSSDEYAKQKCLEDLNGQDDKFVANFNTSISLAKIKADGVMKERVRAILNEKHESSNEIAAAEILKELKNNFAWKEAVISVYDPCVGFDDHTVGGSIHYGFREHGKNWFVIWQNKDARKGYVSISDIEAQVSDLARKGITHEHNSDREAKTVYDTLMKQLRPKPKTLAVVQHGNGLRGLCTESPCPFPIINQAFTFNCRATDHVYIPPEKRNDPSLSEVGSYTFTKTFTIAIGF